MVCCAGRGSFIVDLIADDGRILLVVFENLADHAFAIKSVGWVRQIRALAVTIIEVLPTETCHDNLGMFLEEPCRYGSRWRAHNDADACGVQLFYDPIH